MVTLLKVTSCECWGKAQSQVSIRTRKYYVSDQMTQQVKYVLCHSNKKSCNEYKHTVPKVATLIDKTNLVIKKKKELLWKYKREKHSYFLYTYITHQTLIKWLFCSGSVLGVGMQWWKEINSLPSWNIVRSEKTHTKHVKV